MTDKKNSPYVLQARPFSFLLRVTVVFADK